MVISLELVCASVKDSRFHKWHLAFTTICCCRVLRSLAKKTIQLSHRWRRLVLTTIFFRRVLASHVQEAAKKANQFSDAVPRSRSFLAVDINPPSNGTFVDIDQASLTAVIKEKNLECLVHSFGGVGGVVRALQTHEENGIQGDDEDLGHRCKVFGSNTYEKAIFLVLGNKKFGLKYGWLKGGGGHILDVFFAVYIVTAIFHLSVEKYLQKSFQVSNNFFSTLDVVDVVRDGLKQQISASNIVVGDVVYLNRGDQVPADGLLLDGQSLKVDESSFTGESDHVEVDCNTNPFLLSGTKVTDGYNAKMVVTTVGMKTLWAEKISSLKLDHIKQTPLQARIESLSSSTRKVNLAVATIVLVVVLARYFSGSTRDEDGNREFIGVRTNALDVIYAIGRIILVMGTIAATMDTENFLWVFMITLAHSIRRMKDDKVFVRTLSACEIMGSVTTVVTDTLNHLKVTKFWLGLQEAATEDGVLSSSSIAPNVIELIQEGVGLNTTGSVYRSGTAAASSNFEFSGNPIEKAILSWAVHVLKLNMNMEELKQSCTILHVKAFTSEKQRRGVLMRKKANNTTHVHWKGAADKILAMCSSYYDTSGVLKVLDDDERMKFEHIIQGMSSSNPQFVAFAHAQVTEENTSIKEDCLTLLGLVCLEDPSELKKVVEACLNAGVGIKMITSDDISTAIATAIECGILKPDQDMNSGLVIECEEFQRYSINPWERKEKIDELRVMARSSPSHKLLLVQCLKRKGHVVAVTGNGNCVNEGIQGKFMAKEKVDIVILDNNFASVATILRWGRCVPINTQKLIQFQLTANIVSLSNCFIAVVLVSGTPMLGSTLVYTLVQLIWVNLFLGMFAAVALGMEQPDSELMQKPPVNQNEPLITNIMWRNIVAQVAYQIAIAQTLQLRGQSLFGVNDSVDETMSFFTSIFCVVFNLFNARKLEKRNIFEGIHKNKSFMVIVATIIIPQMAMVELLPKLVEMERLNGKQLMLCIGLASVSWPIGLVVKFVPVPDKPFLSHLYRWFPYLKRWLI